MKLHRLAVETVPLTISHSIRRSAKGSGHSNIQYQSEIGLQAPGSQIIQPIDQFEIDPSPITLIGYGRVNEPVTKDDPPAIESRQDKLTHVLSTSCCKEQQLSQWFDSLVQNIENGLTNLPSEHSPARLEGRNACNSTRRKISLQ